MSTKGQHKPMTTLILPESVYSPTLGAEMAPGQLLARYVKIDQAQKALVETLKKLKAEVEGLRLGETQIAYPGKQSNMNGEFIITHVGPFGTEDASVKVLREWVKDGIITPEQYAAAVTPGVSEYNRIRFKKT